MDMENQSPKHQQKFSSKLRKGMQVFTMGTMLGLGALSIQSCRNPFLVDALGMRTIVEYNEDIEEIKQLKLKPVIVSVENSNMPGIVECDTDMGKYCFDMNQNGKEVSNLSVSGYGRYEPNDGIIRTYDEEINEINIA